MGEQRDRMLRGDWYLEDAELVAWRRRVAREVERFNALPADADTERFELLAGLLGKLGDGARVLPGFHCIHGSQISIGANAFLNNEAYLMDDGTITIGDDVRIGPRVQLLTALHPMAEHEKRRAGWERTAPIVIGDNAWLGGGVLVCPGVTIGANAVVGAGSVVTRDVPEATFAAGNPARVIRRL